MKNIIILSIIVILFSCGNKSGQGAATFCDTACLTDTIKFMNEEHELKPYLYISVANCRPDSVIWSYRGMGINRKLSFTDIGGSKFPINKDKMYYYFNDTSYISLLFNNCENGRGFFVKIPFDKSQNIKRRSGALNAFDPKFNVEAGLAAYTDKGNLFVEDIKTGKEAMMTFGVWLEGLDYDALHEYIDSINVTPQRIWARILIEKEWKTLEKNITLQSPAPAK